MDLTLTGLLIEGLGVRRRNLQWSLAVAGQCDLRRAPVGVDGRRIWTGTPYRIVETLISNHREVS